MKEKDAQPSGMNAILLEHPLSYKSIVAVKAEVRRENESHS